MVYYLNSCDRPCEKGTVIIFHDNLGYANHNKILRFGVDCNNENIPANTQVKKWDIEPKRCACTLPRNRKFHKVEVWDTFVINGRFSIVKFITID